MELSQWLPVDPWIRTPFSVVLLVVVLVALAKWLPWEMEDAYKRWCSLIRNCEDEPSPSAGAGRVARRGSSLTFSDRRIGLDRRSGIDRRQMRISVLLDRRSGHDRRIGGRPAKSR